MSEDFMCITSIRNCLCCDKEMKGDDDFCVDCEKDDLNRQLAEARGLIANVKADLISIQDSTSDQATSLKLGACIKKLKE